MNEKLQKELGVEDKPTDPFWVTRLRKNNEIWLVKEHCFGRVSFEYEPPEPGRRCGRLGISKSTVGYQGGIQDWFIHADGTGLDGGQLILPVRGHLAENPKPIPEANERQILRQLEFLNHRVAALEALYNKNID